MTNQQGQQLEANFSTLILSIGSSAAMALGQTPNPTTGKTEVDLGMARFNIDLLKVREQKTEGHLDEQEQQFLTALISDLQLMYVNSKK